MKFHLILTLLFAVGCGGPQNTAGGDLGDMNKAYIHHNNSVVVTPVPETLYIVMDPAKVADEVIIEGSKDTLIHFRGYLAEAVQKNFEPYFQSVEIVAPGFASPTDDHFIADVQLDGVEAHDPKPNDDYTYLLVMKWSVSVRPSQETHPIFMYSGTGEHARDKGSDKYGKLLQDSVWKMVKSARDGLDKDWTDKKAYEALQAHNASKATSVEEDRSHTDPNQQTPNTLK